MSEVERFNEYTWGVTEDEHGEYVRYADYDALAAEAQALRQEVAALRARVAVVPDASTVYAALDARERLFTSPENIQVALEAQSRLNGMTVSEELLRRLGQVISWQCFGDCRAFSDQRIPEPSEVIEELRALLSELEGGKP
ncbi:TPA: hypothetical protein ACWL71_002037 [Pseudomonas aeruginosa]